jgi:hypothetical protein
MKPFNLEAAKAGKPIQTRAGKKITYIAHVPDTHKAYRVVVLREPGDKPVFYSEDGVWYEDRTESIYDLFMATEKETVFVNFWRNGDGDLRCVDFTTAEAAQRRVDNESCAYPWIAVAVPVEIEV